MKFWQKRTIITYLLSPFSLLFFVISQIRRGLYRKKILKSYCSPVPVLIVGNLSVGGNGKTPVVIWLVEQLQKQGIKVGVISRGYGGKNRQYPQWITPESDPIQMGDEPVLIAQRTQVPVVISPNREQSITLLLSKCSLDLIISDDGLQHYALEREIEWVVIDGERRFGNGFVLPAGSLRELPSRLNSVQAVICNGKSAKEGEHQMMLLSQHAVNLRTGEWRPLADFRSVPCVAMAGIGYPPRFFTMLSQQGITLNATYAFADHQAYTLSQLDNLADDDRALLMTEKDAVKCRAFAKPNWWYIPVSAHFSTESTACLLQSILTLVRKSNE